MVLSENFKNTFSQTPPLIIPLNGRHMPMEYTANVVLWAQPATIVGELLAKPLRHTVELDIAGSEVARINGNYTSGHSSICEHDSVISEDNGPYIANHCFCVQPSKGFQYKIWTSVLEGHSFAHPFIIRVVFKLKTKAIEPTK
jgi:hypothetical protein